MSLVEILRSTDPVHLSWAVDLLSQHGIRAVLLDLHTSVLEGSVGALPRRVVVDDDEAIRAHRLIERHDPTRAERSAGPTA